MLESNTSSILTIQRPVPWSGNVYISMNWSGNLTSLCFGREAVYGRGTDGRTNDDRGKDVVPLNYVVIID